jgi:hypothetical protein
MKRSKKKIKQEETKQQEDKLRIKTYQLEHDEGKRSSTKKKIDPTKKKTWSVLLFFSSSFLSFHY